MREQHNFPIGLPLVLAFSFGLVGLTLMLASMHPSPRPEQCTFDIQEVQTVGRKGISEIFDALESTCLSVRVIDTGKN